MKKILLIIITLTFIGCSDDSVNSLPADPMEGLSVAEEYRDCSAVNECYINYRVINDSEHEKMFKITFALSDTDSHHNSDVVIRQLGALPDDSYIVQIFIDETNEVESFEIIDAEIIN